MKAQSSPPRAGEIPEARDGVAYAELLKLAHEEGLKSVHTELLLQPSEENGRLAIVKAAVETERGHFEGLGDADPGNVEGFLAPHLIRVAETRAKARALRDAVNVGVVSLEELDGASRARTPSPGPGASAPATRTAAPRKSSLPPRAASRENAAEGPMSEAQRRYLFRLLAGKGYQGPAAEEFLRERFGTPQLSRATRSQASELIDELLATAAPGNGEGGNGADARPLG